MDLYDFSVVLHNWLRWIIIIFALIGIVSAAQGMSSNKVFGKGDRRIGSILMSAAHLTLLLGLIQWAVGDWGLAVIREKGFGPVMKSPVYRFWAVEHLTGMLIAIVLITIGRGVSKKNLIDRVKFRRTFWFYLIALVVILASVPWPFRESIARPWLRGIGG